MMSENLLKGFEKGVLRFEGSVSYRLSAEALKKALLAEIFWF